MSARTSFNLSPHTLLALMDYLRDSGAAADPAEAVDTAVLHWLAAMKQDGAENTPAAPRGYQWKSLFLPDGSWVRMAYRGDHEYARVEGDRLMYRGRPTSPNRFANEFTDTVRNAWYDLSIRMPGEKNWKMAYQRRKEIDLAARQPTAPAREPSPPPTPAPAPPQAPLPAHLAAPVLPQPPQPAHLATPVPPQPQIPAYLTAHVPPQPTMPAHFAAPVPPQPQLPAHLAAPVPPQPPAYQYPSAPHCDGGTVIPVPPMLQRQVVPGPGWTEPERRKYRYRIEDVAFD